MLFRISKKRKGFSVPLSGIIFREDDGWCSQCIEIDVASQGDTPEEAARNLVEAVQMTIEYALEDGTLGELFARPAPSEYREIFNSAPESRSKSLLESRFSQFNRIFEVEQRGPDCALA